MARKTDKYGFDDMRQEGRKNVMEGKQGWTMFMEMCGVKFYSNGQEIRDEYGDLR